MVVPSRLADGVERLVLLIYDFDVVDCCCCRRLRNCPVGVVNCYLGLDCRLDQLVACNPGREPSSMDAHLDRRPVWGGGCQQVVGGEGAGATGDFGMALQWFHLVRPMLVIVHMEITLLHGRRPTSQG